jgi:O-antigen/teichoic acid export membrane protein
MFWRGVMGYLPVQAMQALVGFGSIVAFTRLLSPEDYGYYALAFSVCAICQCIFLTWLEAAMARFHVAELERGDATAHMATLQRTMLAMNAVMLTLAVPLLVLLPLERDLKVAVAVGLVAWGFSSVLKLIKERMRAEGEVRAYALLDVAAIGGGFAFGVALAAAGWGPAGPLAGAGAATLLCLLWAVPQETRRSTGGRFEASRIRGYAAYGVPVSFSLILSLLLSTTDRFIIAAFLDEAAVGAYHAGYNVGNRIIDVVFVWLGLASGPALVAALERGGPSALRRAAREQSQVMVMLALPTAVGLALVAGPLTDILVGEALRAEAARVTPWVAIGGFFAGLTTHYMHEAFTLGRRTGLLFVAMAIPAVLNLALNLVLVPRFGVIGAAWATAASFVLGGAVSVVLGRRALALPVPWGPLGRCGAAAGVMALVVTALPAPGGWTELLLKSAVGAATYAVVLLAIDSRARRWAAMLPGAMQTRAAA